MNRFLIIVLLIIVGHTNSVGQNYFDEFKRICNSDDTTSQLKLLKDWEKTNPNDPELFTCYFNYYFKLSKKSAITIENDPKEFEESIEISDSNGVKGYLVEKIYYDNDLLNRALKAIDSGIEKFPTRLDMRFGKLYALKQHENWNDFTKEIIKTIDYSNKINNQWTWTNNEMVEDPKTFLLDNIQSYLNMIYDTGDDLLLINMREISERVLKYYPNHIESLSNISITYLLTGKFEKGLEILLKAEKINPKDAIVLSNIAHAYKLKGDIDNAIKYYEKTILYGDEHTKEFAQEQIQSLKK